MNIKDRPRQTPGDTTPGALYNLNRAVRKMLGVGSLGSVLLAVALTAPAETSPMAKFVPQQIASKSAAKSTVSLNAFTIQTAKLDVHKAQATGGNFTLTMSKLQPLAFMMAGWQMRFTHRSLALGGGGGGGLLTPIYDNRFGTGVDSIGNFTYGLRSTARQVWVNNSSVATGNDASNGLTPATAKQSWNAAWALWSNNGAGGGTTHAGDQLMVAGGNIVPTLFGPIYTDTVVGNLSGFGSDSVVYPIAVLSYDPADPLNVSKYGKLVGPEMPILNIGTSLSKTAFNNGNCVVQGLEIRGNPVSGGGLQYQGGSQNGLGFHNCRFNNAGISLNLDPTLRGQIINISKCSFWNTYSGIFAAYTDGLWIQDCFLAHCGWTIGATRMDAPITANTNNGGPLAFSHNFYIHATTKTTRIDRTMSIDSPNEGFGNRGDVAGNTQLVAIDNPIGFWAGAFSGGYLEAPDGIHYQLDDAVCCGSDDLIPIVSKAGFAVSNTNTLIGSRITNFALFDNPLATVADHIHSHLYITQSRRDTAAVPIRMLCDKWSGYNWSNELQTFFGAANEVPTTNSNLNQFGPDYPAKFNISWSNSKLDVMPVALNGTVTNCSTWASAPPGYLTKIQFINALGFASKAAMANMLCYRPDLAGQFTQAACTIGLKAMSLIPQFADTAVPSFAGITPPVIYPTAAVDLTVTSTTFNVGVPKTVFFTGLTSFTDIAFTDLPAGFSNTFVYSTNQSGASSYVVANGSNQMTGVTIAASLRVGMYVDAIIGSHLLPAGTIITAISGTTITMSQNATGSGASVASFYGGGRALRWDGTGPTGTPTIHVVETPRDSVGGPHTTALALTIA